MSLEGGTVTWSDAADGHLAELASSRPQRFALLRQVHGNSVVTLDALPDVEYEADASITPVRNLALAIKTADCAPVALVSQEVVGAVHAGWLGLASNVIGNTIERMRHFGASSISAVLGPCIHACCYEFSASELDRVVAASDASVRSLTRAEALALDVPRAVQVQLDRAEVELAYKHPSCTSCSGEYFSHRNTGTKDRQVTFVERT